MRCGPIIGDPDRNWNIKGLGQFVVLFRPNHLRFMHVGRHHSRSETFVDLNRAYSRSAARNRQE